MATIRFIISRGLAINRYGLVEDARGQRAAKLEDPPPVSKGTRSSQAGGAANFALEVLHDARRPPEDSSQDRASSPM